MLETLFIIWNILGIFIPMVLFINSASEKLDYTIGQWTAFAIMSGPLAWFCGVVVLCLYLIYVIISVTVDTLLGGLFGEK